MSQHAGRTERPRGQWNLIGREILLEAEFARPEFDTLLAERLGRPDRLHQQKQARAQGRIGAIESGEPVLANPVRHHADMYGDDLAADIQGRADAGEMVALAAHDRFQQLARPRHGENVENAGGLILFALPVDHLLESVRTIVRHDEIIPALDLVEPLVARRDVAERLRGHRPALRFPALIPVRDIDHPGAVEFGSALVEAPLACQGPVKLEDRNTGFAEPGARIGLPAGFADRAMHIAQGAAERAGIADKALLERQEAGDLAVFPDHEHAGIIARLFTTFSEFDCEIRAAQRRVRSHEFAPCVAFGRPQLARFPDRDIHLRPVLPAHPCSDLKLQA